MLVALKTITNHSILKGGKARGKVFSAVKLSRQFEAQDFLPLPEALLPDNIGVKDNFTTEPKNTRFGGGGVDERETVDNSI